MYVILDIKGTLKHMFYRGTDPAGLPKADGGLVNTAEFALANWIEEYLLTALEFVAPMDIIAAWDDGTAYRTKIFAEYKAKRKAASEEGDPVEKEQFKRLEEYAKRLLAYIGATSVITEGVEADDIIALLCQGLKDEPKIIHSVDADLLQLADERTKVFIKNEPAEEEALPFHLLRLYKSMVGDPTDEYGGVPGFGPVAWKSLVEAYEIEGMEEIDSCLKTGDFSMIRDCIEADPKGSKALAKAYNNLEQWKLCYELAGLHPRLCYGFKGRRIIKPSFYTQAPSGQKAKRLLANAGCEQFISEFSPFFPTETLVTEGNFDDMLDFLDEHLEKSPHIAFDYETWDPVQHQPFQEAKPKQQTSDYVDVLSQELTGCSLNFGANCQHTVYFSFNHKDTDNLSKEVLKDVFDEIKSLGKELIAHNYRFEEQVTRQCVGYDLSGHKINDTTVTASHFDENDESRLKELSKKYLSYAQTSYEDTLEAAGAGNMSELTGEEVLSYGCDDSLVTAHLYKLHKIVLSVEGTLEFTRTKEVPALYPLSHGFDKGVRVDYERLSQLQKEDQDLITSHMARIRGLLDEYCSEENPAAVASLAKAEEANLMAIDKHVKGYRSDKLKAVMEEKKLKWLKASKYQTYEETKTPISFSPTPKQLMAVAEKIGVDVEEVPLTSAARSRINEWITLLRETYEAYPPLEEFLDLLGAAAAYLSKRKGTEYEELEKYAIRTLDKKEKVSFSGDELNFNSPNQKIELLYLKLGLPVRLRVLPQKGSKRDTLGLEGSPATDEDAVATAIAEDCPPGGWKREVLEKMLEVSSAMTRESLYYRPYPLWKHPRDGLVHPGIKSPGTTTRRPTGTSPNVLQISKGKVRSIIVPRDLGEVIISPDFSGQELRIAGSEAKDPVLIEAYTGGGTWTDKYSIVHPVVKDVHSVTSCSFATTVFQRDIKKDVLAEIGLDKANPSVPLTYEMFMALRNKDTDFFNGVSMEVLETLAKAAGVIRGMAKSVNFLIIYVGSPFTLSRTLRIPSDFAERIMDSVFLAYPRLGPWQEETIRFAKTHGYVKTAYGSRRHLSDDIRSKNASKAGRMERQAVNATIQGCAADILKLVLTGIHETQLMQETGSTLFAPVYDEIAASVPVVKAVEYCDRLQDLMNVTPPGHAIPMLAEIKIGRNWGEMIELGDRPSAEAIEEVLRG